VEIDSAKISTASLTSGTKACAEIFKKGGPAIISGHRQAAITTTSLNQNKQDDQNIDTKKTGGAQAGPIDTGVKRRTLAERKKKFKSGKRL
jgi:hypothetical protein